MTFVRTSWVNDHSPDITAEQLNRIEHGVEDATTLATSASASAATAATAAASASTTAAAASSDLAAFKARRDNPLQVTAKQVGARHHKNAKQRGAAGNGTTEDTAILTALLDELRTAGGGELYLPNDGGTVYKTKGLWVPSNTRIVSDGARLEIIGRGPARSDTGEPQAIFGDAGLTIQPQTNLGFANVNGVLIEGLTINLATDVMDGAAMAGISIGADDVTIRDCFLSGGRDTLMIGGRIRSCTDVRVLDSEFFGGTRNTMSITRAERVWVERNHIHGCTANSVDEYDPGAGLDIEPGLACQFIHVTHNHFSDSAGPGVLVEGSSTQHCEGIIIDGNRIYNFGTNYTGGTLGSGASRRDGVQISGGFSDEYVRVVNNQIHGGIGGAAGINSGGNMKVIAIGNDVRGNGGGGLAGAFAVNVGNITA